MHKNRPQLLVAGPIFLHDHACLHIADVVIKKFCDYGWEVLPHVPYNPDMSPPDFHLLAMLKEPVRGRFFSFLEELSTNGARAILH